MLAFLARIRLAIRRSPLEAALAFAAVAVSIYVIVEPLTVSRYVPMTDLPFHAAQGATFRHYWDPSFHQQDQFELHPFSVPYTSFYALVAVMMLVFPMLVAVKIAVAVHLGLVPAGLAVLFHGAKKSPLLGLLGLGLCWCHLSHWGFLNYMGALGLFSMVIGLTMMVVDRPSTGRKVALGVALLALYFTHIFRFPFALAAVAGTAVVMYPATRRLRPVMWPLILGVGLFVIWWKIRPPSLDGKLDLGMHLDRFPREFGAALTNGFVDDGPRIALMRYFDAAWLVAITAAVYGVVARVRRTPRVTAWDVGVSVVPLACAGVFFLLFLVMPLWIGTWWYVYPREATAATLILLGACPDLPRPRALRVPLLALMMAASISVSRTVAARYAQFDGATEDFYRITRQIPRAPKLFYMIFDHTPTNRSDTPFIHLPAYVQAEKGGWLSWHFAIWNSSPVRYRKDADAVVVPRTPPRWEWTPGQFKLSMATFFDWFLVRQKACPDALFSGDREIRRVDHVGMWWLYRRVKKN